jgi:hypothetical protein
MCRDFSSLLLDLDNAASLLQRGNHGTYNAAVGKNRWVFEA